MPGGRSTRRTSKPFAPGEAPARADQGRRFYALGKKAPPYLDLVPLIRRIVNAFGPKRCMWESDCPFQVVKDRYVDSLNLVRRRLDFLDATDKEWLLRRTAEQTFFEPARRPR